MAVPSKVVYVAGARLADRLFKAGISLIDQGVEVNGTRCFVFEIRPEHVAAAKRILGNAFPK